MLGAFTSSNNQGDRRGDCPTAAAEEASGDCVMLGTSRSSSFESGTLTAAGGGEGEGAILLRFF